MKGIRRTIGIVLSVLLWIGLWTFLAYRLNKPVLLPYPQNVWKALVAMVKEESFLHTLWGSFIHISLGFLCALLAGVLLAVISSRSEVMELLLLPGVKLIKTVPVVSFIILLLFFVKPERISFVISLLMVFPVIYENTKKGIAETDRRLLEAAQVFRMSFWRKLYAMYLPSAVPFTTAACSAGLSLCWKAGIAAELIAQSPDSIGHALYYSKLYVDAEGVFAWTIVLIAVSVLFEKIFLILFRLMTVAVSAPTLWKHPDRLVRHLLGLRTAQKKGDSAHADDRDTGHADGGAEASQKDEPARPGVPSSAEAMTFAQKTSEKPVCVLSGIGKSFDGHRVLSDVSVSLVPGTVTVISGPSGSGKTTLLRILLGLEQPDEGERRVDKNVRMAAVFQENRLCGQLSAIGNVRLAMSGNNRLAMSENDCPAMSGNDCPAMSGNGAEKANRLLVEAGITDTCGQPVSSFSGGMKRRTAWCRALAAESRILVLDEPFTGLDEARKDTMIRLLYEYKKNDSIVIVTHNPSEIDKIRAVFGIVTTITIHPSVDKSNG